MARKPRVELAGGLYHVITRGNNRQTIFHDADDYQKFLSLLKKQKLRLPFFLYAYCLMSNHVHLLMERQEDAIGRVMHRVLTGYSQYYNRKYRRIGHLLQGRYKAILCQSETYLTELVRYIHLNPVRAGIVRRPEHYRYSSHRCYLGWQATGIVDIDPVLRHFGAQRKLARERYCEFVSAGMRLGHREDFYQPDEGRILGTVEFVDATIHRIGESGRVARSPAGKSGRQSCEFEAQGLMAVVAKTYGVAAQEFCGSGKSAAVIAAKEAVILIGRKAGASLKTLSELTGISSSAVSRRYDAAERKLRADRAVRELIERIASQYERFENGKSSENRKSQA